MRSGVPQFAVARYVDDGSLDDYFGSGGKTVRSLGESASVQKLAIGSDGMILLLGFSTINGSSGYGVVALKPDGSVNEGFGDKGLLRSSLPDQGILPAAAIHPNGYAVFAGSIVKSGDGAFCLSRIPIN